SHWRHVALMMTTALVSACSSESMIACWMAGWQRRLGRPMLGALLLFPAERHWHGQLIRETPRRRAGARECNVREPSAHHCDGHRTALKHRIVKRAIGHLFGVYQLVMQRAQL